MQAITSESLTKTYRSGRGKSLTALNSFSIAVQQGEIFSLLGPNGAGKTTFIKILLSLVHSTSGQASILGKQLPDTKVRRQIGYLPESHRYPGYMTGDQVLSFFGRLSGLSNAATKSRMQPLMQLVGMEQWRNMKVRKYSKGMLQRLGLAQALINDPDVVFLDEPTDGVDPVGRKEIRDILKNIKQQGKTVFLNSHLLSEVELVSDRVAILDKGKLLKVGTVDELTSTGSRYQIGISGALPESFSHETAAMVLNISYATNALTCELKTTEELNRLIDLLRKHNVAITSIVKQRDSLEDSFINLIKREVAP